MRVISKRWAQKQARACWPASAAYLLASLSFVIEEA